MQYIIIILLFFSSFNFSQVIQKGSFPNKEKQVSSPSLIERDYANHTITLDQRVTYLVFYLNDYSKLPKKYKSNAPEKCGTWIAGIIFNNFEKLKPATKKALISYGFK